MKKSEIKNGMLLERRDGQKCIYINRENSADMFYLDESRGNFSNWNEDLIRDGGIEFADITKIYSCEDNSFSLLIAGKPNKVNWTKIWEREPEVEEISADEAMRRLEQVSGKKIKITR